MHVSAVSGCGELADTCHCVPKCFAHCVGSYFSAGGGSYTASSKVVFQLTPAMLIGFEGCRGGIGPFHIDFLQRVARTIVRIQSGKVGEKCPLRVLIGVQAILCEDIQSSNEMNMLERRLQSCHLFGAGCVTEFCTNSGVAKRLVGSAPVVRQLLQHADDASGSHIIICVDKDEIISHSLGKLKSIYAVCCELFDSGSSVRSGHVSDAFRKRVRFENFDQLFGTVRIHAEHVLQGFGHIATFPLGECRRRRTICGDRHRFHPGM